MIIQVKIITPVRKKKSPNSVIYSQTSLSRAKWDSFKNSRYLSFRDNNGEIF